MDFLRGIVGSVSSIFTGGSSKPRPKVPDPPIYWNPALSVNRYPQSSVETLQTIQADQQQQYTTIILIAGGAFLLVYFARK